jgi:hypothetical protein
MYRAKKGIRLIIYYVLIDSLLTCIREQADSTKFDSDKQKYEEEIFEKMLCAMYLLPYHFENVEDFIHLNSVADYYRALPIVSGTLTDALLQHKSRWIDAVHMREEPFGLLEAAAKLGHESLFRDCLTWTVTPWAAPEYLEKPDFKFKKAADKLRQDITTKVANAHQMTIYQIGEEDLSPSTEEKLAALQAAARNSTTGDGRGEAYATRIHLPEYFYKIRCSGKDSISSSLLDKVLQNNLIFSAGNAYAGHGDVRAGLISGMTASSAENLQTRTSHGTGTRRIGSFLLAALTSRWRGAHQLKFILRSAILDIRTKAEINL